MNLGEKGGHDYPESNQRRLQKLFNPLRDI